jgi:hypothetical protein
MASVKASKTPKSSLETTMKPPLPPPLTQLDPELEYKKTRAVLESDFATLRVRPTGTQQLRAPQDQNPRNAVVLAVNHKPIACSESGYEADKWNVTPFTVVRIDETGFSKAPYSKNLSKQKLAEAKPLAVMEGDELRLYSFKKASMAKGDREDDITFKISPGDTFKTFMELNKYKEMKRLADPSMHMLPTSDETSVIPAFSLLEVTLASKNSDAALGKNSCVNILKIRRLPEDVSMHSIASVLGRLPNSLNDALLMASTKAVESPCISQDLVRDNVAFYKTACSKEMSFDVVELPDKQSGGMAKFVRLCQWSLEPTENLNSIDVPEDVVLRMCNAGSLDHAIALLQIASAMDAVSVFVTHDAFLAKNGGSPLRGVPLVDVAKMLKDVKFEDKKPAHAIEIDGKAVFSTACMYDDGESPGLQEIRFSINTVSQEVDMACTGEGYAVAPSQDFPIMLPGYKASKSYSCVTSIAANETSDPPKERVENVLIFSINATKRSASSTVFRGNGKRKLSSMQFTA